MNSLNLTRHHALALAAFLAVSAQAQTVPPGAGDTLRDLSKTTPVAPREATATLQVPADADAGADLQQRFHVNAVRVEGNQLIATAQLQPLVDGLAGKDVTLGELRAAARSITELYRASGFVVARAFVPAQRLDDGVVKITVLEGSLHASTVQNQSKVRQETLDAVVAAQDLNGKVIRNAPTDRTLLLLADLPGVGAVNGLLKPGEAVGTSDLMIPVQPGKDREGDVSADNYGNRYTGAYRLNGHVDLLSPLARGDRLSLRGTVSEQKLVYGRAAYDLPANNDGLRAGAAVSSSHYDLGKDFKALDASGTANTLGAYALYPIQRGLVTNVWASGAVEQRWLTDKVGSSNSTSRKDASTGTVTLYGDIADSLGGGAYSTWSASMVGGHLDIRTKDARDADQAPSGPKANGNYLKVLGNLSRLQAITADTSAYVSVSGQRASKNLDSSEKFVLGGIYGVRAYPQGEGAGDDGWLASVELRHTLAGVAQASVFYDAGHTNYEHVRYGSGSSGESLRGYGVGVAGVWRDFNAHAVVAWRDTQKAVTAPDHRARFWLSAGWSF